LAGVAMQRCDQRLQAALIEFIVERYPDNCVGLLLIVKT
jgi:hypothetical protein